MLSILKVSLFFAFFISCVGTIEDKEKIDRSTEESPKQNFTFLGAQSGLWVSNTALSIRFAPAIGGSGKFRYELIDDGGNIITGQNESELLKDSNGVFHLTYGGFPSGQIHRLLVRAIDLESDIKDDNTKYIEINLPDDLYPDFDGFESCSAVSGAGGENQISVNWTRGAIYPGSFGLPLPHSVGSYKIYYCKKSDGTDCLEESSSLRGETVILDPEQTSAVVSGLDSNSEYYFRVTAESVGITGSAETKLEEKNIEFGICKTQVSSGPIVFNGITNVTISDGEAGMNEGSVEWEQASGGYQGYILYYHPIVDQNSAFNYLDPNIQKVLITDTLAVDFDVIGLDSFSYHAFLVKACPDLVGDPDCNDGNDANEKFIVKETKPLVGVFAGIDNTANDPLNPSNVFLNFLPVSLSNGGIFDEYRVILNDGTNEYDITNSSALNTLGNIYPGAPATYQSLYLDGFARTNILSTFALIKGLQPGVIYSADVQAWVNRSAPLPISGGTISVEYGTTNTAPVNISNSDTTPPLISSMTVTPVSGILTENDKLTFTVSYNESIVVSGTPRISFNVGGVVKNADLIDVTSPVMTFEYTIINGDNDLDGLTFTGNSILLNGGGIEDLSGNNANLNFSALAPDISTINVDTIPPSAPTNITFSKPWLSSVEAIQSAAWNNPSSDFAYADVGVGSSGSGIPNAVTFSQANNTNSNVFADIRSSLVECVQDYEIVVRSVDAAGLLSPNAVSPLKFKYDATPPQPVTVSTIGTTSDVFVANEVSWTASSDSCELHHYEIAIGKDEDSDGFDSSDVDNVLGWSEVPGQTATTQYQAQSGVDGMIFSLNATDDFYVSIRGVDAAGNPATASSSAAWIVDIAGPSTPTNLSLSQRWLNGALPISSPVVSWTNPTEPDFDHIKIALGASIGQEDMRPLTNIGTFSSYTWTGLNSAEVTECNRNYPKVIAYDNIGNPSIAATDPNVYFVYDNQAPVLTGDLDTSVGGESLAENKTPLTDWSTTATKTDNCSAIKYYELAIGFDNDGDGFDTGDIENLASFRQLPGGDSTTQYQAESGIDGFNYSFNGGVDYYMSIRATDEAGNISTALTISTPFSFVLDNTGPVPTVTSTEVSPSSSASFPITITFDEDVTGFSQTGISVTNGSVGNFTALSATVFTADITPQNFGSVTIDIPIGSAIDAAGNPNQASTSFTILHTSTSPMVSVWQTTGAGETITLPLRNGFSYDALVDWGDGSTLTEIKAYNDPNRVHTYASAGNHTVTIYGKVEAWFFNNGGDKAKILTVTDLGDVGWRNLDSAFQGCSNLTVVNGGNTSQVTSLNETFREASIVNPNTSSWDTGNVTNMNLLFYITNNANPDVSGWNTSKVTTMYLMFGRAQSANPDVSNWDVSKVVQFQQMFDNADSAQPDTSSWVTSSATNIAYMFRNTELANPDVSGWDTSKVTTMIATFQNAKAANPDVSSWDTSNVTNFNSMFYDADLAEPDTSLWNTSKVTNMNGMFRRCAKANPNTSNWDTSRVTSMNCMFCETTLANPDTSSWDTSRVTDMISIFWNAAAANPDTSGWDTSRVTKMNSMFQNADLANPNTSGWDTSNVTDMTSMFRYAQNANPNTSGWDTSKVTSMAYMFDQAPTANPDTSSWNTSNVTTFREMFYRASNADPDTSSWDTAKVTTMYRMFRDITADPDTSGWDTSSVTNLQEMFYNNSNANPDVSGWDTSKVTTIQNTFGIARNANPDVSGWDTSNVISMHGTFQYADLANPDTSGWNTSSATRMDYMFRDATSANPDVSGWDTSNVTNFRAMFYNADSANPNTSSWNTSSAISMREMFMRSSSANPDVSGWDTSNVTTMLYMFYDNDAFDGDMSGWDLSGITPNGLYRIFIYADSLSNANWGSFLVAADATAVASNLTEVRSQAQYPASAATARTNLINNLNWSIVDAGAE